jgi:hypothetical protein
MLHQKMPGCQAIIARGKSKGLLCGKTTKGTLCGIHKNFKLPLRPGAPARAGADTPSYEEIIAAVKEAARETIPPGPNAGGRNVDGRVQSYIGHEPFLEGVKEGIMRRHSSWDVSIQKDRKSCDIIVSGIRINLKISNCTSCDNANSKPEIYFSITGQREYPANSNWNQFFEALAGAKQRGEIKTRRDRKTEYHYLVLHKTNGAVLLKSIFDLTEYRSNPSNALQIHWGREFEHETALTPDSEYLRKVTTLLACLQESVRMMIDMSRNFADANIGDFIRAPLNEERAASSSSGGGTEAEPSGEEVAGAEPSNEGGRAPNPSAEQEPATRPSTGQGLEAIPLVREGTPASPLTEQEPTAIPLAQRDSEASPSSGEEPAADSPVEEESPSGPSDEEESVASLLGGGVSGTDLSDREMG